VCHHPGRAPGAVPAYAEPRSTPEPTPGHQPKSVTLITGDRVVVTGAAQHIEPGQDRQVSFTRQVIGGHVFVIPSDAQPLLDQGLLDRRLFDVTQLLAWRYDDAATPDIPLIIRRSRSPPAPASPKACPVSA